MKVQFRIVLGIMLLVATAVAQEAPQDRQQATINGAASRRAASGSTAPKKGTAPNTAGAKPIATLETPILTQQDKRGYALGVELGLDVAKQGAGVNQHLVMQGIRDALTGQKYLMMLDDINTTLTEMQQEQREKMALAVKEFAEKNKKDGEAFLAANKAKEGIVTLPSGLQYEILKTGQKTRRNGNTVCQDKGKEPHSSRSPRISHCPTTSRAGRRKENAGREQSRLWQQRRRVEGSGTRSGSLRGGAALSQEQCSRKYRRSA